MFTPMGGFAVPDECPISNLNETTSLRSDGLGKISRFESEIDDILRNFS
jgi:hypothetical protein